MSDFTWIPSWNSAVDTDVRINACQFGDGYKQRSEDGINAVIDGYSLIFDEISPETCDEIDTFLRARAGVQSFNWTPPGAASAKKMTCEKWKRTFVNYRHSMTAEFIEVFE